MLSDNQITREEQIITNFNAVPYGKLPQEIIYEKINPDQRHCDCILSIELMKMEMKNIKTFAIDTKIFDQLIDRMVTELRQAVEEGDTIVIRAVNNCLLNCIMDVRSKFRFYNKQAAEQFLPIAIEFADYCVDYIKAARLYSEVKQYVLIL